MVNLSSGTSGIITFRDGTKFFCPRVNLQHGRYLVEMCPGWLRAYTINGLYCGATKEDSIFNITSFEPCEATDARAAKLPHQTIEVGALG